MNQNISFACAGPGICVRRVEVAVFTVAIAAVIVSNEPEHEISKNVVCATSKASDQPTHTRSLIRAFASRLSII